jgi:SAM-dependent methyltransferase
MAEQERGPVAGDSPDALLALFQSFMGTAAMKAGLDLELFTHIANGADTAEKLAAAKHLTVRAARILCDALVAFGTLGKENGRYTLPAASRMLLVKGSPAYMGGMATLMGNRMIWNEAGRLTDVVKAGHALVEQTAEVEDNPFWQDFARGSRQMAQMAGPAVADAAASMFAAGPGPKRILDIACGSGFYGFSALKRFPDARLVAVDWPGVLKLAEANARQAGVADRVEFRPGDIFASDMGRGYDLVLAVNIYHHFSIDKCIELSRRLYDAAAPGGVLLLVDAVADEAREKERFALAFALTMLIWTHDGDTYTLSQYEKMLKAAGFKNIALKPIPGPAPMQAVVARR